MTLRCIAVAALFLALCGAHSSPLCADDASARPVETGTARFEPLEDQAAVSEMFRLEPHSFDYALTPLADVSRSTDVAEVTFPSPVTTPHECNNTVHCEYFRARGKDDEFQGRRPAVVVLHILGGDFPLARLFARYLASTGTHALFVKMPYYGPRRPVDVRKRMIEVDPRESVVGMRQAILDIRRAAALLASRAEVDPDQIGIFGISLGGITAALAAEQEPRFRNVCLMLAGGDLGRVSWESPEVRSARDNWLAQGRSKAEFFEVLRPIDPATYAERLQGRRMLMINAKHDEIVPPACTESLWEGAGRPRIVWFDAGHYTAALYLFHGLAEVTQFFRRPPLL
jgi:pimeloyl-ACP methyl ester carboxylesterase